MFCSDGVDPLDIEHYGHIDHCVREAISNGVDAVDAFSMASKNCFDYYNMGKKGYGGQKFPKLAKPAKTTKKVTRILTCTVCKKKSNTYGIRVRKFELVAA